MSEDKKDWREAAEQRVRKHDECERAAGSKANLYYNPTASYDAHVSLKHAMTELKAKDKEIVKLREALRPIADTSAIGGYVGWVSVLGEHLLRAKEALNDD